MDLTEQEISFKKSSNRHTYIVRQVFCCIAIILNYFIQGLYMGSVTLIVAQLRKEANSTEAVTTEMASWLSSSSSYCALPWAIILPPLGYRFGRKILLVIVSLSVILGNMVFYFSTNMTELIISQAIQGILQASMNNITVMIMSEYTSPRYRGTIATFKSATLFWGIWVSNAIGTFFHWRVISIFVFGCCTFYISILFCPESPYWLATKGRFEECTKIHRWLKRTDEDSEEELRKLISSQKEHLNKKADTKLVKINTKILQIVQCKSFHKPLAYATLLFALYNLSGKMAYTVYAIDLIKGMTSSEKLAYEGMLILDGVTIVGMYLGCIIAKFVTRRTQLLTFSSSAAVLLYVLSSYTYLIKLNVISENNYVSLFLLTVYSFSVSCGPILIINCCVSELSPLRYRSYFVFCIAFVSSISFATTLKIAPFIFIHFDIHGAFLFFAIILSFLIILTYLCIPETKDKTILEIQDYISGDYSENVNTEIFLMTKNHQITSK